MSIAVEIKDLKYVYNSGSAFSKTAVDGVSLTITQGDFVGLIGHTGSGKSTLIQHMNALIKPSQGAVFIDGADINADKSKLKDIRRKVGLVFQYPEHQLFEVTVFKDVAFGPGSLGLSEEEVSRRVHAALKLTGISEDLYQKSPFELSGGQKRRVAIAGVLAMEPSVLILDEPTAGLDPRGRDGILENLKHMHRQLGITIILVSHSMEDVSRLANRIIVMHQGKIALSGTTKEVFSKVNELEELGLAAPQISYLLSGLEKKGFSVPTNIFTTEEATNAIYQLLNKES